MTQVDCVYKGALLFILFTKHALAQDVDGFDPTVPKDIKVPGSFPEAVNRELAWYGMYQIQPMLLSSKNRMVSILIWMHALNRPHVILETAPENLLDHHRIDRSILSEEAARWSKDQRTNHENVMDTFRTGGNGITIRTVIGANRKPHTLIIYGGSYYRCVNSHPDIEAYKKNPRDIHDKKCEDGNFAVKINPNVDACIEGEVTPMEYSFHDGWAFCFGIGERPEASHFLNGTLNCGTKTKVSYESFLDNCAIDENVVIDYVYFGDEPRKEPADNGTLCKSWAPCELSYVYRLEPPDIIVPAFPTTTKDPCELELCTIKPDTVLSNEIIPEDYVPPWLNPDMIAAPNHTMAPPSTTANSVFDLVN